ncbi:Nif3-like dinuclear metal center hexameric protein [Verrucomicrobium sp. BvORR106]|uniref:Nif3-like dinuclear metal center hexameric protein n=1 Tax=Verrucomicrobium sp. BvORR106 TaxID=1403819 RepID=UPI0005711E74|nr:Nif3-like dinuclear metal center hexameric protein [Verrucomicrobium sp. BvORR106]
MKLADLVAYVNELLQTATVPDYGNALNGLQLENYSGDVSKIAVAVDAHLPVVKMAAQRGCDLLLVHHGIFWSGLQPLVGPHYQKLRVCGENDLAIYSAHLPLDGHLELGNGIQLARALELPGVEWTPFFPYKGFPIGVRGEVAAGVSRDDLSARLEKALGAKAHLCPGGPEEIRQIGIVTGGAGDAVATMKEQGIDTFITGEGPHWSYTLAEELGVNLYYGGHYATETFGVKALAAHLSAKFGLPWEFIDHPTGL